MEEIEYGPLTLRGEDEYKITYCEKDAVRVAIPAAINGIPVVAIGDQAFKGCELLEEVTFPDDEELLELDIFSFEIGSNAFTNCNSLKEIELADYVNIIGHGAFYQCRNLERVVIRSNYHYVAPYAFASCESLREITDLNMISEGVFQDCRSLTSLPISEEVDEIEEDAFERCMGLTDITIPRRIGRIESEAFSGCRNLKRITFENPEGWFFTSRYAYAEGKRFDLNLSDAEKNAKMLSGIDFDDGIHAWQNESYKS